MYLDDGFSGGGGFCPTCRACRQPIEAGQQATRIHFRSDPDGTRGYSGEYHLACSRPFASLARIVNLGLLR